GDPMLLPHDDDFCPSFDRVTRDASRPNRVARAPQTEDELARSARSDSHSEPPDRSLEIEVVSAEIGCLARNQDADQDDEDDSSADETREAGQDRGSPPLECERRGENVPGAAEPREEREDRRHVERRYAAGVQVEMPVPEIQMAGASGRGLHPAIPRVEAR